MIQDNIIEGESIIYETEDVVESSNSYLFDDKYEAKNVERLLFSLFQQVNIASVISKVKKDSKYIVKIPSKYLKSVESGELSIMKSQKTGNVWPMLVKVDETGKNQIVAHLPIEPQKSNLLQDISAGVQNLYFQKQIETITDMLQDTLDTVKRIEEGQQSDRIGLMESGKMQIRLAMFRQRQGLDDWSSDLSNGRKSIYNARGEFLALFKQRVSSFEPIPSNWFKLLYNQTIKKDYATRKDLEYNELLKTFELINQSTNLISASYLIIGEDETAAEVCRANTEELLQISYDSVITIKNLHNKSDVMILGENLKESIESLYLSKNRLLNEYDAIDVSIDGERLLEVLNCENI